MVWIIYNLQNKKYERKFFNVSNSNIPLINRLDNFLIYSLLINPQCEVDKKSRLGDFTNFLKLATELEIMAYILSSWYSFRLHYRVALKWNYSGILITFNTDWSFIKIVPFKYLLLQICCRCWYSIPGDHRYCGVLRITIVNTFSSAKSNFLGDISSNSRITKRVKYGFTNAIYWNPHHSVYNCRN